MLIFEAFAKRRYVLPAIISEWFAGGLAAYARRRVRGEPKPPADWKRILITGDNHLGDVLMRTASLPALRRGFPSAELFFLTSASSAPLLAGNPHVDHILTYANSDSPYHMTPDDRQRLRAFGFDTILITNPIRYWPYLDLAIALGIANRAAFTHKGFSGYVTYAVPIPFPDTHSAYLRSFVAHVASLPPHWSLRPQLFYQERDIAEAATAWRSLGFSDDTTVAAIFCTTRQTAEVWPSGRWAEGMRLVREKLGAEIVLFGTEGDRGHLAAVAEQSGIRCRVLAGVLSLRGLAAFLRRCAVVVCPDSGSRHLGNAAGVPVVYLRNLACLQAEAAPYCETERDAIEAPGGRLSRSRQRELLRSVSAAHVSNVAWHITATMRETQPSR